MPDLLTFNNLIHFLFIICMGLQIIALISIIRRLSTPSILIKPMLYFSISSILLCTVYYSAIQAPNVEAAHVLYSISLIFYNSVVFCFYYYANTYTEAVSYSKVKLWVAGLLLFVDAISLVVNIFVKHIIYVESIDLGGITKFTYRSGPFHIVHYLISVIIVIFGLGRLAISGLKVPKSHRNRYFFIGSSVVLVLFVNILFLAFGAPMDLSGIILPFAVVTLYYYSIIYSPAQFLRESRAAVIDEMVDGILIFDFEGKFQDSNKIAKKLFNLEKNSEDQVINNWLNTNQIDISYPGTREIRDHLLPGEPIVSITIKQYYEKNSNILAGTYLRIHDKTAEINKNKEDIYNSNHDSLTGLYNKTGFFSACKDFLDSVPEDKLDYYLVCSNIENFKLFNTLFGADKGDLLLKNVGEGLKKCLSDYKMIARMEGDRFCVLIPRENFEENKFELAYLYSLDILKNEHNIQHPINIYLGVYHITKLDEPVSIMYNHTLMAAQTIKGSTEELTAFYDNSITDEIIKEQHLITELRKAMVNEEFEFYIQPQVCCKTGEVFGGEALVRWNHPEKGILSPFFFIDVMESHGMISALDVYIWEKVCKKLKDWKDRGIEQYISVNISNKDFYFMDVRQTFLSLVEEYQIDKKNLKLEITESAVMQDEKRQLRLIEELRESGFTVEMDDFGSGYSSLNMLDKMQIDVLKLDMEFIRKSENSPRARIIIENIQRMASSLKIQTIAEGVETKEQADFLISVGCDTLQGYFYSPPISVKEYEAKYLAS